MQFVQSSIPSNSPLVFTGVSSTPTLAAVQFSPDGATVYAFTSFVDATGILVPTSNSTQVVTADASVAWLQMNVNVSYRVLLNFFDNPPATFPASCGAPLVNPTTEFRPGIVIINSICFWNNAILYFPANSTLQLNAFPFPGFAFLGWTSNLGPPNAYLRSYPLKSPVTLGPVFEPAKRVRFLTNPPGLQVLVDRTPAPTLTAAPIAGACPQNQAFPVAVPATFTPLCFGDFDFIPGSSHLVGAPTPQIDIRGNTWVFDSWAQGQGQNAIYTADSNASAMDTVTVNFVPGAHASFVTNPTGLALSIDGRANWPGYNFIWAVGSTHQVSAPPNQLDAQGRKWIFQGWSNNGPPSQNVTLDPSTASSGFRIIANYTGLSRIVVQSSPPGLQLQLDGAPCQSPCTADRANGSQVHVIAPLSVMASDGSRLDFASWSDGGLVDHQYTIVSTDMVLTVNYATSYSLTAYSDPPNAVNFTFDPVAPDMFYPSGTPVTVTAQPRPGFKFRRWSGDLTGTYNAGSLIMSSSHTVTTLCDRIPFIAPAGVQNAAAPTSDGTVAASSLISITGESLAPEQQTGRTNPFAQSVGGVYVTIGDRLLPLVSVSPQQVIAQLPSDLSPGGYSLQVHSPGQPDVSSSFTVDRDAPGLFPGLFFHADGSSITSDNPAVRGETITMLGTGFGPYVATVLDGFFPADPAPMLADAVQLSIAGAPVAPVWAGAASGYAGTTAIRLTITSDLPPGPALDINATVNGKTSNTVSLPVQ